MYILYNAVYECMNFGVSPIVLCLLFETIYSLSQMEIYLGFA